jgi:hypothetical protein
VEAYQIISRVYVKTLHERTNDMWAAMCTCITQTHVRARFTCYYRVTCDNARSRRGMLCLMSSLFLSCDFLLVNSTTPRLPRQPRLVAHREVPGGGSWNLGRSNLRWTGSFNIYRRHPIYGSSRTVHSTL